MNLISQALAHYRRGGFVSLVKATNIWLRRRILQYYRRNRIKYSPPLPPYKYTYSVGDSDIPILVRTHRELDRVRTETEKPVHEDLLHTVRPDDVFFDVGANIGRYSCVAAEGLENGQIVAFEPLPANVESLRRNFSTLSVETSIHEVALGDESGETKFEFEDETAGAGMGRISPQPSTLETKMSVRIRRGDDLVSSRKVCQPNVVKIDVEGAELDVIRGMRKTIGNEACRSLYIEVHLSVDGRPDKQSIEDFGGSVDELLAELEDQGFSIERLVERNTPVLKGYVLKASR